MKDLPESAFPLRVFTFACHSDTHPLAQDAMTDPFKGDKHDWVRGLVTLHQSTLIRYAQSITHDEHSARDIVQETFLKLCQQDADALAGREAAWLFRVCHNVALNRYRKERRMTSGTEIAETTASDADPTQGLTLAEDNEQLTQLLDDLPDNQQKVIRLKFHAGLKYREISAATGLSEGNVGFLLHTALQTLRKRMQILGTSAS